MSSNTLELLAPAKTADVGIEAINHGADAVYIGGPLFGARAGASNALADVARLASYAHRFNARVLVALNTILDDEELEEARQLAWQLHEAGADALILQDMGLLELGLPPLELHASTQCDIRTPQKARFLEDVGFSQLVLARELSLAQIRAIAAQTSARLEFFVHGALCVSYSGQCYLSYARTGRSANRGDCAQACRLRYSLVDEQGQTIATNKHLLSLKDNEQSTNLRALIDAGIRSFKIEGRLKDLDYVKNATAHYRQQLDAILENSGELRPSSSGRCTFFFTPQLAKTFNRGATDYFLNGRQQDLGAFASPTFVGEKVGAISRLGHHSFEVSTSLPLHNGDGLTYFVGDELFGLRVNRAERVSGGYRFFPSLSAGKLPAGLRLGMTLYRNHDQDFARQLEKKSAERRIALSLRLAETADGFALRLEDEAGVQTSAACVHAKQLAEHPARALSTLRENLGKLGNTIYCAATIELALAAPWFIPVSVLNALRREAITALDARRQAAYRRPSRRPPVALPIPYPESSLSYLGNVYNQRARRFYEKHGVNAIAPAYECEEEHGEVSLMLTKHCLRYSFNLCPKQVSGVRPDPLLLLHGKGKLTLHFDCQRCEMHVVGKLTKRQTVQAKAR